MTKNNILKKSILPASVLASFGYATADKEDNTYSRALLFGLGGAVAAQLLKGKGVSAPKEVSTKINVPIKSILPASVLASFGYATADDDENAYARALLFGLGGAMAPHLFKNKKKNLAESVSDDIWKAVDQVKRNAKVKVKLV